MQDRCCKGTALSDKDVLEIASKSANLSDKKNRIALPDDKYAKRLNRLVGQKFQDDNITFNYGVYIRLR